MTRCHITILFGCKLIFWEVFRMNLVNRLISAKSFAPQCFVGAEGVDRPGWWNSNGSKKCDTETTRSVFRKPLEFSNSLELELS